MIDVTRLNGEEFIVNCEMIESIAATPDTVILLTSGRTVVVQETPEQLLERTVKYRRKIFTELPETRLISGEDEQ